MKLWLAMGIPPGRNPVAPLKFMAGTEDNRLSTSFPNPSSNVLEDFTVIPQGGCGDHWLIPDTLI